MEGSRLPNRLIFGTINNLYLHRAILFFIPLYLKECAKVEKRNGNQRKKA